MSSLGESIMLIVWQNGTHKFHVDCNIYPWPFLSQTSFSKTCKETNISGNMHSNQQTRASVNMRISIYNSDIKWKARIGRHWSKWAKICVSLTEESVRETEHLCWSNSEYAVLNCNMSRLRGLLNVQHRTQTGTLIHARVLEHRTYNISDTINFFDCKVCEDNLTSIPNECLIIRIVIVHYCTSCPTFTHCRRSLYIVTHSKPYIIGKVNG